MTLLDDTGTEDAPPPHRSRRRVGPLVIAVVVLALLVALGAAAVALLGGRIADRLSSAEDYPGPGSGSVTVEVEEGATLTALADDLVEEDVVASREAFLAVANADERAAQLQPGFYELRRQMSAAGALDLLFDPTSRVQGNVTIPEGFVVEQVVERLVAETDFTEEDVRAALEDTEALGLPEYANGEVEGYLFPATYTVDANTTAQSLLQEMVAAHVRVAEELDLVAGAEELGLTPHEVVTLASLVQAEAKLPEDFGRVSRVALNRLEIDMPLQFDSTINYAREERKRENLTLEDLELESPYNTYRVQGLPPGPIGNPGRLALEAALEPTPGDWLYFVTIDTQGTNAFAVTYEEFLRLKAEGEIGRQEDPAESGSGESGSGESESGESGSGATEE